MKKKISLVLLTFSLLFSGYTVGQVDTISTYIVGPFRGLADKVVMCQAITDHTYILTEEEFFNIKQIDGHGDIFALGEDGVLYTFVDSLSSWSVENGDHFINSFVVKRLSSTNYHIILGTSQGVFYKRKGGSWTDKSPNFDAVRKDLNIVKFAASPVGFASSYNLYFANKKGLYTTTASGFAGPSPSWSVIKGIFVDEDFESYTPGDNVWGGRVEFFEDTLLFVSTNALTFGDTSNYSANVSFNLPAQEFTAYFTIYTDSVNTPEFRVDFIRQGNSGSYVAFYIEFKNGGVYLNNIRAGNIKEGDGYNFTLTFHNNEVSLSYSSLKGVSGGAGPISATRISPSDRISGFKFVFGATSSSKFFIDDVFIVPYELKTIAGHASNRNYCFFLLPYKLAIYDKTLKEWREVMSVSPDQGMFEKVISVPYADSILFVAEKIGTDSFVVYQIEDTTGDYSAPPVLTPIYSFTGEYFDFYANPDNPNEFLISFKDRNGVFHVMFSSDGGATFNDVSSGLAEGGPIDWTGHVNSFYAENDTTFFAGTYQGVFRKTGDGNWEEFNTGLLKRFVPKSQILAFASLIETFPWNTFYNELGPLGKNRDNDDKVVIVLSETGYVLSSDARIPIGYSYSNDAMDINKMEFIQIDPLDTKTDVPRDLSSPEILKDVSMALSGLHMLTYDPEEPSWLLVGAELVGYHILKTGSLSNPNTQDTFVMPSNNILDLYINTDIDNERQYAFPFIYNLMEEKGLSTFRNWWQDKKYKGLLGLTMFAKADSDIASYYEEVLYKAMRGGFNNIIVSLSYNDFSSSGFWVKGYSFTMSPFTYRALILKNPTDYGIISNFKYKGTISNGLYIHPEGEALITTAPPREGSLTLPQDTSQAKRFLFVGYDDGDVGGADQPSFTVAIGVDNDPPEILTGFFHTSFLNRKVRIFVFSSERVFTDPSNSGPSIFVIGGNDTTKFEVVESSTPYIDTLPSGTPVARMYTADADLNFVNGTSEILIKGSDLLGNDFADVSIVFNEWITTQGTFVYNDGSIIINTPEGAFPEVRNVVVGKTDFVPVEGYKKVKSPYYVIGTQDLYSIKPCVIKLKYPGKGKLYRYENGHWVKIEGGLDENGYYVASVNKFGIFAFLEGSPSDGYRFSFDIPRNILRNRDYMFINVSIPESVNAKVIIYNSAGRVYKVLHNGFLKAGSHVFAIDTRGMPAGNYFITFRGAGKEIKKKVIKVD